MGKIDDLKAKLKKVFKNGVADNGDILRKVANWFEENVDATKQKFKDTKIERAIKIANTKQESTWEMLKYYLQQLHNTNKIGVNAVLEYFSKMSNAGLVDNALLRKMEKAYAELKKDDKKFVKWLKKHPSISSYFSYWLLIAALSFATWGSIKVTKNHKEKKEGDKKEIIVQPQEDEEEKKNEKDPYGNIALFEKTRSKIKFALSFVENHHDYVYWCGKAWTTGDGLTIEYNADGTYRKVTKNSKVHTIAESDVYKGRYLTFDVLPDVQKLIKVPMDENTLIAFCVFRYCVGHDGLVKSQYLKQLNNGVKGDELAKWFTRYRQDAGVQNRMYFFAALMANKITFDDLLDLRAEGCYNLDWQDIFYYQKDKQGNIKKGADPIQDSDGCYKFDYTNVKKNLEKAKLPKQTLLTLKPVKKNKKGQIIEKGKYVKVNCKLVKEIVPDYIWQEVSGKKQKTATIKSATSKVEFKGQKKQTFANATLRLRKGKTFNSTHLFARSNTKTA